MVSSCKMSTEVQFKMSKLPCHCYKYIETSRSDYKMKKQKILLFRKKCQHHNVKITERGKIDSSRAQIHHRSL